MKNELKSCPFCGGKALLRTIPHPGSPSGDDGYQTTISCLSCSTQIVRWALKKTWAEKSGRESWNSRVNLN